MDSLNEQDPRTAEVLESHYFGGLSHVEMSEVTGLSTWSLDRTMRFAKAWLRTRLDA